MQKYTETKINVIEQDVSPKVPKELALKVQYTFLHSNDSLFYKTLCINDSFQFTDTPYIAIYDADVLLKLNQLELTMEKLRNEKYHVVYPYDGKFLDVPEHLIPNIINSLSVDHIDDSTCTIGLGMPEVSSDRQSFGGVVFFERTAFIKGGMANQNLISYGPEDVEFYVRFKKLGYNIIRIPGPVYHLHHSRGINSMETHSFVQRNHSMFKKIMELDDSTLKLFVSTWPWIRGVQ